MRCPSCQARYPADGRFCPADGTKLRGTVEVLAATQALYDPLIGQIVDGRYRLEAPLGAGGMGVVYAARHVVIEKRMAVKLLRRELTREGQLVQRFVQEARAASQIGHPNIVDITDFGEHDGQAYFVMELLDGATLAHEIEIYGALPIARVLRIGRQIALALGAAHGKGIVHRDVKPENVFLIERDGQADFVKVLDFGVAKIADGPRLTRAGAVFGTPEHMSPEQARGAEADHRADVYALGVLLFEMAAGRTPFQASSTMEMIHKHLHEPPPALREARPDGAPAALDALVQRMLAKSPDERPQAMEEVAEALRDLEARPAARRRHSGPNGRAAAPASEDDGVEALVPRARGAAWAVGAALLLGAAAAVWAAWPAAVGAPPPAPAGTRWAAPARASASAPPAPAPPASSPDSRLAPAEPSVVRRRPPRAAIGEPARRLPPPAPAPAPAAFPQPARPSLSDLQDPFVEPRR